MMQTKRLYQAKEGAIFWYHKIKSFYVDRKAKPRKTDTEQHYHTYFTFLDMGGEVTIGFNHIPESLLESLKG